MESVVSKLQETGQHVAKKSDLLLSRTRDAGEAFLGEVKGVGRELVGLMRTEAKGWKRFLAQRTSRLQSEAKAVFTPSTLEREILTRVDGTLRSLDSKVRERLGTLEKPAAKPARRKGAPSAANGKRAASKRRARVPASRASVSAATVVAGARH